MVTSLYLLNASKQLLSKVNKKTSEGACGDRTKEVTCDLSQVGRQEGTSHALEYGQLLRRQAPGSKNGKRVPPKRREINATSI